LTVHYSPPDFIKYVISSFVSQSKVYLDTPLTFPTV